MPRVTPYSALSTAIYGTIAGAAYATFGDLVDSDLLLSYPQTTPLILARLATATISTLSYPILSYPVPSCLGSLLHTCVSGRCGMPLIGISGSSDGAPASRTDGSLLSSTHSNPQSHHSGLFVTDRLHIALVICYLLLTASVALVVTDLGMVVGLIGALSATVSVFIMGPLSYLFIVDGSEESLDGDASRSASFKAHQQGGRSRASGQAKFGLGARRWTVKRYLAAAMVAGGLVAAPLMCALVLGLVC